MDKQLLATTPLPHRAAVLRDNCYKVYDNETYTRRLEPEEVADLKTDLFDNVQKTQALEDELKETQKELKAKIKELKKLKTQLLREIQFESVSQTGTLYAMDYQNEGMLAFYDPSGQLVMSRPLKPEERQTSFLTVKTGTYEN